MDSDPQGFETADGPAFWPSAPEMWSYSSIKEVEACPRRWMLSRARYPDYWDKPGYPDHPSEGAIFGNVVHRVVERLTAGTTGQRAELPAVLREQGGWESVISSVFDEELRALDSNPRARGTVTALRAQLTKRIPEMRAQAKTFTALALPDAPPAVHKGAGAAHDRAQGGAAPRGRLGPGAYPEQEVSATDLRLSGTIDHLVVADSSVSIVDFKTGSYDQSHQDQVRLYALIWSRDQKRNPDALPASSLRIAYATEEAAVPAPTPEGLEQLEVAWRARVDSADRSLTTTPPEARPSEEACAWCKVRQFCSEYWRVLPAVKPEDGHGTWGDFEGVAIEENGPRSWFFRGPNGDVLVRTANVETTFPRGQKIRILSARWLAHADSPDQVVLEMQQRSEWWPVVS